jgi:hypothetical protein
VTDSALVAGNSYADSLAMSTGFYDPYYRAGAGYWELPVRDVDIRLNIPDLTQPRAGGQQVEYWSRQFQGLVQPVVPNPGGLSPVNGVADTAIVAGRAVSGSQNNLPDQFLNGAVVPTPVPANINNTNLVWSLGSALPTTARPISATRMKPSSTRLPAITTGTTAVTTKSSRVGKSAMVFLRIE